MVSWTKGRAHSILLLFAVAVSVSTLQVFQRYSVCHTDVLHLSFRSQPPLHVCRDPTLSPKMAHTTSHQPILYQCAGPLYDDFATRMMSFADNTVLHGMTWGRRDYPLLPHSTILMLGNSHTRQVGMELACQYSHVLRTVWRNEQSDLTTFEFENNSTLHLLTNTPIVYSYEWKSLLEVVLGKKLFEFDAIVLGIFNQYPGQVTTNFDKGMIDRTKDLSNVDYINIKPPTPWKILEEFGGHMAIVSMFTKWNAKWMELERIAEYHGKRVQAIDARKYIPLLGECGSDARLGIGECYSDDIEREGMRRPDGMHRCVGAQGGHPDLIAWEVIEFLHTVPDRRLTPNSNDSPASS